jgi:hypothetical protein
MVGLSLKKTSFYSTIAAAAAAWKCLRSVLSHINTNPEGTATGEWILNRQTVLSPTDCILYVATDNARYKIIAFPWRMLEYTKVFMQLFITELPKASLLPRGILLKQTALNEFLLLKNILNKHLIFVSTCILY